MQSLWLDSVHVYVHHPQGRVESFLVSESRKILISVLLAKDSIYRSQPRKMPFTDFPHAPQLPPLLMRSASTAERSALPLHPLLQPMRSSRSCAEPTEHADSPEEFDQHHSNIQRLLNAERWAHHRTLITLRNEIARRDQLDQQIALVKQECQALSNEWSAATKNFTQCDTERLDLVREVQSLRSELEAWQLAYQEMSGVVNITLCWIIIICSTYSYC